MLRRDIDRLGYDKSFTIYDTADQETVIKSCLKELSLDGKRTLRRAQYSAKSATQRTLLIGPIEFEMHNKSDFFFIKGRGCLSRYTNASWRKTTLLDFDDLIGKTVQTTLKNAPMF